MIFCFQVSVSKLRDARLVEGEIGKAVSIAIQFAANMLDGKVIELAREFRSAFVKRPQVRAFYFVPALHLANQEFGIAANAQRANAVAGGIIERGKQRKIFGDIVRLPADIFCQLKNGFAFRVAQNHSVGSRARIAAGSSVNIGNVNACGRRSRMRIGKKTCAARRRNFRGAFHSAGRWMVNDVRSGKEASAFTGG